MIHPTPWTARRFGYERTALLDANGAEVAEFVNEVEAALCAALVNDNSFRATLDTSRPPFARLKAPQRPQTAAHAVKEMLSRKRLPEKASWADQVDALLGPQASSEEMERRFLKAHARIAELARGNTPCTYKFCNCNEQK